MLFLTKKRVSYDLIRACVVSTLMPLIVIGVPYMASFAAHDTPNQTIELLLTLIAGGFIVSVVIALLMIIHNALIEYRGSDETSD